MLSHPKPGQRVRIHYAKLRAALMPYHGKIGVVRIESLARGPGPRRGRSNGRERRNQATNRR